MSSQDTQWSSEMPQGPFALFDTRGGYRTFAAQGTSANCIKGIRHCIKFGDQPITEHRVYSFVVVELHQPNISSRTFYDCFQYSNSFETSE